MIGYITLGSNNIAKAGQFYDALLSGIGATRLYNYEQFIAWSINLGDTKKQIPLFCITTPFNKEIATVGNGAMIGLIANSKAQVDALHAKALSLGATDEGAPGIRSGNYYCAYFRDLDGNKINFHYIDIEPL